MENAIRYGSVCSGVEAASLAWHSLGWEAAWFSEIEAQPRAVLAERWPDVIDHGDMLTVPEKIMTGEVEAPAVLVGGTPCQSFSVAGARAGLEDDRGQLTIKYVEVANAIDDQRRVNDEQSCVVVWENVPGVLSHKDNPFGAFLGLLCGESIALEPPGGRWKNAGCVYGPERAVAWRVLDAQYFGVAQRRRRLFVVASARKGFDPRAVLFESEGVRRDTAPSREKGEGFTHDVAPSLVRSGRGVERIGETREQDPVVACFGGGRCRSALDVAACITGRGQRIDFEVETFAVQPVAFSSKDWGGDAMTDCSPTLRAGGHATSHANAGNPPAVAFNARQDPDSWHERTGPLDTDGCTQGVYHNLRVRRLTPVECERLMGMPDNHTAITYRGKPMADGPRYKMIGNSMAVPVMAWIGKRIDAEIRRTQS